MRFGWFSRPRGQARRASGTQPLPQASRQGFVPESEPPEPEPGSSAEAVPEPPPERGAEAVPEPPPERGAEGVPEPQPEREVGSMPVPHPGPPAGSLTEPPGPPAGSAPAPPPARAAEPERGPKPEPQPEPQPEHGDQISEQAPAPRVQSGVAGPREPERAGTQPPTRLPSPPVNPPPAGLSQSQGARSIELRLARLHLRTGALALARAELEILAGRSGLDQEGALDLAEVRWRTGDLAGASEASSSYVSRGGDEALAFVIAAEAAAAQDRPAEARRLAGRALEKASVSLDDIFAGIPRASIWPLDTISDTSTGLFGSELVPARPARARQAAQAGSDQPALWDATTGVVGAADPDSELRAGEEALASGDATLAALHFGIALRLSPTVAASVAEAVGDARDAALAVVHGDALRLLGYEWGARRAYLEAAELAARQEPVSSRQQESTSDEQEEES